jgi:hypothetical protein
MLTPYHAKLYAHELTRRCPSDSVERFTAALMDSQVDLNVTRLRQIWGEIRGI